MLRAESRVQGWRATVRRKAAEDEQEGRGGCSKETAQVEGMRSEMGWGGAQGTVGPLGAGAWGGSWGRAQSPPQGSADVC